jgi:riboflavin kinase/FMN adenylyltransferase
MVDVCSVFGAVSQIIITNLFFYFCIIKLSELKIWDDISNFDAKNPVITIGSFDGVHLGHQQVLKQLNAAANRMNGESVVFTFSPHPVKVLAPNKEFVLLNTLEERIELFRKAEVDHLVLFPFTLEFSQLTYAEFVKTILVNKLHMNTLLIGYDNTIGKNKEGDYKQVLKLSKELNYKVFKQDEIRFDEHKLSSTYIRELLTQGKLLDASKLLGYAYMLSGTVVHGQQIGNKLGFPTANVLPADNKFIPGMGVYAVMVEFNNFTYKGMMNIGVRPTIDDYAKKPIIEAHLFDFHENLYGEFIKINIIRKLRNEYKFESVEALRAQLKKDKLFALETLEKEFGIK